MVTDVLDNWEGRAAIIQAILDGRFKVVREFKVSETGRVAAEFRWQDNDSGLLNPNISWWVFELSGPEYNDELLIWISAERLRRLAYHSVSVRGGDMDSSEMFLVELDWLIATNERIEAHEARTGRQFSDEQYAAAISKIRV